MHYTPTGLRSALTEEYLEDLEDSLGLEMADLGPDDMVEVRISKKDFEALVVAAKLGMFTLDSTRSDPRLQWLET